MNTELRFGVLTSPSGRWEQIVERWQTIETMGFDSVWLPDHFVDLRQPRTPRFEAWTLLPALATQTTRIRIGTLVTAIPFRNPAFVARQALTVEHISRGRLELDGRIQPSAKPQQLCSQPHAMGFADHLCMGPGGCLVTFRREARRKRIAGARSRTR